MKAKLVKEGFERDEDLGTWAFRTAQAKFNKERLDLVEELRLKLQDVCEDYAGNLLPEDIRKILIDMSNNYDDHVDR